MLNLFQYLSFLVRKKMFLNEYIDENYITKKPEHFNFAFDVVDRFAIEEPEKKALVWCDDNNSKKFLLFQNWQNK